MFNKNQFGSLVPVDQPNLVDRFRPDLVFEIPWLIRCRLKILILTDASGGFTETQGFHLGQIVKILNDDPWSHIQFQVAKAHRGVSPEADVMDNFRFDAPGVNLSQYSQVWLIGISRSASPLSQSELAALSQYMDDGGGVFATGDHEDLGKALAGEVPRVRSMRRWYHGGPGPNGEPEAPDQTGSGRHDTIANFGVGTQVDPEPQEIRPRLYSRSVALGSVIRRIERYPHPVLCGPNGVINYLPDHMHEGHCEEPSDLSKSWTFGGQAFTEYPSKNGFQQRPEVIAWAKNNVNAQEFGVLAAYDGHRVDVGRVVVDATWHHWFNINTLPYINASNPAHPTYTPTTVPKWAEIKAYYRNVAVWLARPSLQRCIRNGGWIRILGDYDIAISTRDLDVVKSPVKYFWQLGTFARDALGRGATQCQTLSWIIDLLPIPFDPPFSLDPWRQFKRGDLDSSLDFNFDFKDFEAVLLGAAVHEARMKFQDVQSPQKLFDRDEGREVEAVLRNGVKLGIDVFEKQLSDSLRSAQTMFSKMRQ